jgi:hypothetical protein
MFPLAYVIDRKNMIGLILRDQELFCRLLISNDQDRRHSHDIAEAMPANYRVDM